MFPVRYLDRVNPADPRIPPVVQEAAQRMESWLALNPARRAACSLEVSRLKPGRYRVRGVYRTLAGSSAPIVAYSD